MLRVLYNIFNANSSNQASGSFNELIIIRKLKGISLDNERNREREYFCVARNRNEGEEEAFNETFPLNMNEHENIIIIEHLGKMYTDAFSVHVEVV